MMNEQRCLSDEELDQVVVAGPHKLYEHSEDRAHMHLLHDMCDDCFLRLMEKVILGIITESLPPQ